MSPRRFLLLSPCGWGNLGDAAILDSAIAALRARAPDAELVGITLNPADTRRRHGIQAFPLRGFSRAGYEVADDVPSRDAAAPSASASAPESPSTLRRLARRVPLARAAWRAAKDLRADVRHRRRARGLLRPGDTLVVAGGGQLDDFWGGPFGHPHALARWTGLARSTGARVVVLSVGTGSLRGRLSRRFVRRALARADYVSFRDEGSRELAGAAARVPRAAVVPDLAYAVPRPLAPVRLDVSGPCVGVSPMIYRAPRAWPDADAGAYGTYLEKTAALATGLLERGAAVVLFETGGADARAVDELRERLDRSLPPPLRARLLRPPVTDVAALLGLLSGLDAVVSARLHGVLLTHVAGRPCVAVSHERKVRTLMREMDQEDYCVEIAAFEPAAVLALVDEVVQAGEPLRARVRAEAARRHAQVEAQYDSVFGPSTDR